MIIGWFSCGVTSAVACKIASQGSDPIDLVYFEIDSAHPDNDRFIKDCESWIGMPIKRIRSKKYRDQFDVIEKTKYINGPNGARCTSELKKSVRQQYQKTVEYSGQIFGFEYSKKEFNRAVRFAEQNPIAKPIYPLIEKKLTKTDCIQILQNAGIEIPAMYRLGYSNNNCIACVKGGGGYFDKIRNDFPEYFNKMADLEKRIGRTCINGIALHDLPKSAGRFKDVDMPDCGLFCEIEFEDIIAKETEKEFSGK